MSFCSSCLCLPYILGLQEYTAKASFIRCWGYNSWFCVDKQVHPQAHTQLCFLLRVSVWSPGWPGTQSSSCLCGIPVGYQSGPALAGAFSVTPAHTEFGLSSFLSTGPSSPTRSLGEGLSSREPCNCAEAQGSKATLENEDKINSLPDLRSLGPEGLNT